MWVHSGVGRESSKKQKKKSNKIKCQCLGGKHCIFEVGLWFWQGWGHTVSLNRTLSVCWSWAAQGERCNKGSVKINSLYMVPRDVFENKFAFRGSMGFETKRETFCRIG